MKYVDLSSFGRQEDPFFFALETELLKNIDEDLFFIWHVYGAVIIGKHQLIDTEVNQAYLDEHQIKVFRRLSGGGAVYSDEGCIKYSFLSKKYDKETIFKEALNKIKGVFDKLNINVEISGRNDILFEGKKFSGNAFYRNSDGSCLHGTILFDTNFETLVKSITPSNEKLISKGIESVRSRVINLKPYISMDQATFETYLQENLCDGHITLTEEQIKNVLDTMDIYHQDAFIKGYNPAYAFDHKKRFEGGTLGIKLDIKKDIIIDCIFYGDYFLNQDDKALRTRLIDQNYRTMDPKKLFSDIDISTYFLGITNENLYELLEVS